MVIKPRPTLFMRKFLPKLDFHPDFCDFDGNTLESGCDPLTPGDIAEVIVFAASRRENVVIADTLIFPNHQVS